MTLRLRTMTAAAALLAIAVAPAQAETNFIANSFFNAEHPLSKHTYVEWAEALEEASGGALKAEVYLGTVLLAPRATLQGIRDNVIQVGIHPAVYTPSEMPVAMAVQELGFNYSDSLAVLFAVTDWSMNHPSQVDEWKTNEIVYLGGYATPAYYLFCREPVTNMAEIQGKRLRTAGSTVSRWVEEVGAIPVNVPSSEMYSGLDRGTLDCATNAANDLIDRSLWEVAPHTTVLPTGMYYSGPQWGFNVGFWSGLTDEERRQIMDVTSLAITRTGIQYAKRSEDALKEAAEKGNTIHEPAEELVASVQAFREKSMADVYTAATGTYGLENGKDIIDSFQETVAKWEGLLEGVDRSDEAAVAAIVKAEIYDKLDASTYGVQ
ncbi:MAG: C4-dicarboxylate TRAP transporter substrate-binding protein [Pseudomonadota bacterium]